MRRLAWEAWARAGVFLAITLRLDLRYVTALVRDVCVGVAYNLGLAARGSAFVMLMRELHDETRRDEVLQRSSGREAEAPRSSGHWVPERGRRDSAQAAPPPPVPMGAPDDDDVAPRAAAQESGGGLPGGTQAAARGPPGQARVLKAASPTVDASRSGDVWPRERSVPVDAEAPRRACGLKAGARVSQDGHNQGRRPCQRDHRVQRPEEWLGPESPQERPRALSAAGAECLPAMPAALLQQLPTEAAQTGLALALARHGPPPPPTETAPCLARDPQVRPEEGEGGTTGTSADHNRSRSSRGADD